MSDEPGDHTEGSEEEPATPGSSRKQEGCPLQPVVLPPGLGGLSEAVRRAAVQGTGLTQRLMRDGFGVPPTVPVTGTALEVFTSSLLKFRSDSTASLLMNHRLPIAYQNAWYQRLHALRTLPVPADLLEKVAAAGAGVLPPNLRGIRAERWRLLIDVCQADGISVVWAPRGDIVAGLLDQNSPEERQAHLAERQEEVLDDVEESLHAIDHPLAEDWTELLLHGVEAHRAGHWEAAQALAANVLDSAMKSEGRRWVMASFPDVGFNPQAGSYKTLKALVDASLDFGELTLFDFVSYLTVIGMSPAFDETDADDQVFFNRHLGAHYASYRSYQPGSRSSRAATGSWPAAETRQRPGE
ncbi:hypothetical protein ACFQ10_54330 [Streptomyces indonesiensis]